MGVVYLASETAVDQWIVDGGSEEGVLWNGWNVGGTTDKTSQSGAANLLQLWSSKGASLAAVLEPVAISELEMVVLDSVNTGKGWSSVGTWEVALGHATSPKVNVFHGTIRATQLIESIVWNEHLQILPTANLDVEAIFNIMDVTWNSVITATPNVGGGEVASVAILVRLVQVVADIVADPRVDGAG